MTDKLLSTHTMLRWISAANITDLEQGIVSAEVADEHVSSWINKGYELFNTHYIGENRKGYGVMYILKYVGK